ILDLSPLQKRIFLRAAEGMSNASIARDLGITQNSIQGCFRAAYEKIQDDPAFRAAFYECLPDNKPRPAAHKRHALVEVLRRHIEELRPWHKTPHITRHPTPIFSPDTRLAAAG